MLTTSRGYRKQLNGLLKRIDPSKRLTLAKIGGTLFNRVISTSGNPRQNGALPFAQAQFCNLDISSANAQ